MRNNFFQEHVAIKSNFNFQHKKATLKIQSLGPTPTCYWSRTLFILNCFAFSSTKEDKTVIRKMQKNQPQDSPVKFTVTSGSNYYRQWIPTMLQAHVEKKLRSQKRALLWLKLWQPLHSIQHEAQAGPPYEILSAGGGCRERGQASEFPAITSLRSQFPLLLTTV